MRTVLSRFLHSAALSVVAVSVLGLLALAPHLFADSIGVTVNAHASYDTNLRYPGGGCANPDFPSCEIYKSNQGLTTASVIAQESGTTSANADPADTASSAFASVSATEGHVGLSFSADSEGIGTANGSGSASWTDIMTVGSSKLAYLSPVTLVAEVSIDAEFVGLGRGNDDVQAFFSENLGNGSGCIATGGSTYTDQYGDVALCTKGSYSFVGDPSRDGPPVLPATVRMPFTAYVGTQIPLLGEASGDAYSNFNASWSMLATNSAHFSITPLDPSQDVTLTLASGCSISSGYGCDAPPTGTVPEPATWLLLASGIFGLALLARRRVYAKF